VEDDQHHRESLITITEDYQKNMEQQQNEKLKQQ